MKNPSGHGFEPSLASRTLTAAQWRFASIAVQSVLQFGVTVLLSRLLPPRDFGLVALALIVTGFARVVSQLGIAPAVIQRRPLTDRHLRAAFTLSVLLGLATAVTLVALAPLSAWLFHNSQVPAILRVVAWTFAVGGVGNTAGALLRRKLDFRRIFVVAAVSYGVGYAGVAVTLALLGFGVWALVLGALTRAALGAIMNLLLSPHPCRPLFDRVEVRELLGYGVGTSMHGVGSYLAQIGDNFVTGRWLGSERLGLYTRAYGLMMLTQDFVGHIALSVLFPAFSEIQHDRRRLGRAYLFAVQLTSLGSAPLMAGILVAAPHLIRGLYGENWSGAILPLQILCAFGLGRSIFPLGAAVARASGDVYALAWRTWLYAGLVVGLTYLATPFGLPGIALGVGAAILAAYLMLARLALSIVSLGWRDFFGAQASGLLLSLYVAGAALAVRFGLEAAGAPDITILIAIVGACALALLLGMRWLPERLKPRELSAALGEASGLPRSVLILLERAFALDAERR
ncbi:MAG: lipopolysaccharide biosynthesis protein [Gemmatimonadota bacterium]